MVGLLALSTLLYLRGLARLRERSSSGRGLRWWEPLAFGLGQLSVVIALLSPLDALSDVLFSAHMGQHEVLMLISAPLLVLGRPGLAFLWALKLPSRVRVGRWTRRPRVEAAWRALTTPWVVLVLHAVAVWSWHLPGLFEAALRSEVLHALQHACFFLTAALFWWTLLAGQYGRLGYGVGVIWVFLTALHTGLLGALATVAPRPWYGHAGAHGLSPLEDQQLAGLIMWVPAGALMLISALALCAAWLGQAERRVRLGKVEQLLEKER